MAFGGAVITSSFSPSTFFFFFPDLSDLFRRESYGDQSFIVSYQKFNFGEVPMCGSIHETHSITQNIVWHDMWKDVARGEFVGDVIFDQ